MASAEPEDELILPAPEPEDLSTRYRGPLNRLRDYQNGGPIGEDGGDDDGLVPCTAQEPKPRLLFGRFICYRYDLLLLTLKLLQLIGCWSLVVITYVTSAYSYGACLPAAIYSETGYMESIISLPCQLCVYSGSTVGTLVVVFVIVDLVAGLRISVIWLTIQVAACIFLVLWWAMTTSIFGYYLFANWCRQITENCGKPLLKCLECQAWYDNLTEENFGLYRQFIVSLEQFSILCACTVLSMPIAILTMARLKDERRKAQRLKEEEEEEDSEDEEYNFDDYEDNGEERVEEVDRDDAQLIN